MIEYATLHLVCTALSVLIYAIDINIAPYVGFERSTWSSVLLLSLLFGPLTLFVFTLFVLFQK